MLNALSKMSTHHSSGNGHRPESLTGHHHHHHNEGKAPVGVDKIRRITVAMAEVGREQAAAAAQQKIIAQGNKKRYDRHRAMTHKYDVVGYDGDHDVR